MWLLGYYGLAEISMYLMEIVISQKMSRKSYHSDSSGECASLLHADLVSIIEIHMSPELARSDL